MHVFVTGAAGFIGAEVVRKLIDANHHVVGLVRSKEAGRRLTAIGAKVQMGSIEDIECLHRGAAEADGVIHLAFFHKFSHANLRTRLRILLGGNPRLASLRFTKAAAEADRRAIETFGTVLSGRDCPLVVAIPTMSLSPGGLATEEHAPDPNSLGSGRVPSEIATLALAKRGVRSSVVRLPPLVHDSGGDKNGLLPLLIRTARDKGISAYVGEGTNRWPAVHRLDAAQLFKLALEKAPAGSRLHAVRDEGVPFREIAVTIGQHLNLKIDSIDVDKAGSHFGWIGAFASVDNPVSSAITQERLGWRPVHPSLIEDIHEGHYFRR
ncbi:3-beta hydroxysteroid dehydrogenase [Paenibacillus rhizosphaerae]|uniref:3-beta hydroxysteroid dehydrogenase n=1 Tax=Paenibacillus rhizosphaerae TaxID=297318 RepID=A0A1R1DVN0_9BACL|nr:SDR family oxidoreductase [Paenibacillus rhizosphaerae]OMF43578.1 3-beta hydroxysteroid dehydrogenase [Paenibacillus rhizosphaerae]